MTMTQQVFSVTSADTIFAFSIKGQGSFWFFILLTLKKLILPTYCSTFQNVTLNYYVYMPNCCYLLSAVMFCSIKLTAFLTKYTVSLLSHKIDIILLPVSLSNVDRF